MERVMHWWNRRWIKITEQLLAHAAAVAVGVVMMIIGLALGVTMVMLPAGIVIGLAGVAIFVGGIFGRIDQKT
jgi:hypothetical protein